MADATAREWLMANRLAARIQAQPEKAVQLIVRKLAEHRECAVEHARYDNHGMYKEAV